MQVGFQQSQQSFETNRIGTKGSLKMNGKFFREANDPLKIKIPANVDDFGQIVPWFKDVSFLWNVDGKRFKFEGTEVVQKAIESGDYFDSPVLAKKAKEKKLLSEKQEIQEEINKNKVKNKKNAEIVG